MGLTYVENFNNNSSDLEEDTNILDEPKPKRRIRVWCKLM